MFFSTVDTEHTASSLVSFVESCWTDGGSRHVWAGSTGEERLLFKTTTKYDRKKLGLLKS